MKTNLLECTFYKDTGKQPKIFNIRSHKTVVNVYMYAAGTRKRFFFFARVNKGEMIQSFVGSMAKKEHNKI